MGEYSGRDPVYKALTTILTIVMSVALAATTTQLPAEENGFSKMVGSFNSSIKSGFSKVTKSISPKPAIPAPSDALSLSVKAKPSANLYVTAGNMYATNGNLEDAENMYQRALKISSKNAEALTGYALLKHKMGSYDEAVAMYEKAAKAHPQNATVFNGLGLCHAEHGNFDRALAGLERAVQLQPRELKYRNNIAMVLVEMGRYDNAFAHFRTQYDSSVAHYNLAYLIQKRGDKPSAFKHFAAAVEENPNFSEARVWYNHLAESQTPERQTPHQQKPERRMLTAQPPVNQQPRQGIDGPSLKYPSQEGPSLASRQPHYRAKSTAQPVNRPPVKSPRVWVPRQQPTPPQRRLTPQHSMAQRPSTVQREATAQKQLNALGSASTPLRTSVAPVRTAQPAAGNHQPQSMAFRPNPGNISAGQTTLAPQQNSIHRLPPIEQSFESTPALTRQLPAPTVPLPQEPAAERVVGELATTHPKQTQAPQPMAPTAPTPQIPMRSATQFNRQAYQHQSQPSQPTHLDRAAPLPGPIGPSAPPASGTTRAPIVYPLPPVDDYRY